MRRQLITLALICAAATAQGSGDEEKGRIKGYTCTGCHAIPDYRNAYPSYRVPKIGGQNAEYIVAALKAYRDGQRPHSTMHAQAANLSDQDMADIAAYFSSFK